MISKLLYLIENNLNAIKVLIPVFYFVGIIGNLLFYSYYNFNELTVFALIFTFFLLMTFHQSKNIKRDLIYFGTIFIFGILIEIIGVQTGIVFGNYKYGNSLGVKIFETPLIIGLNWLMLVYLTLSIVYDIKLNNWLKILIASLLMLFYDIVLEQVAPILDYWTWENNIVPLSNYIAWFIIALIFNTLILKAEINLRNPLAIIIYLSQLIYLFIIMILNS